MTLTTVNDLRGQRRLRRPLRVNTHTLTHARTRVHAWARALVRVGPRAGTCGNKLKSLLIDLFSNVTFSYLS